MNERRLAWALTATVTLGCAMPMASAQTLMRLDAGEYLPQAFFFSDTKSGCAAADPNCFSLAQMDFAMYQAPMPAAALEDAVCGPCVTDADRPVPTAAPAPTADTTPVSAPAAASDNAPTDGAVPVSGDKIAGDLAMPLDNDLSGEASFAIPEPDAPADPMRVLIEQALADSVIENALVQALGDDPVQTMTPASTPPGGVALAGAQALAVSEPPLLALMGIAWVAVCAAWRRRRSP